MSLNILGYRLEVGPEACPQNPLTAWDGLGTLICFHSRYSLLGHEHDYRNPDEFVQDLIHMVRPDVAERLIEKASEIAHTRRIEGKSWSRVYHETLMAFINDKVVILPLYLYDHSGITMNTTGFSCRWDSGQVGWVYATKDDILRYLGGKYLTKSLREKACKVMVSEVAGYDHYLRGDVYQYEILDECGETVDSCYGFYGEEEAILEGAAQLAYEHPILKCLRELFPDVAERRNLRELIGCGAYVLTDEEIEALEPLVKALESSPC